VICAPKVVTGSAQGFNPGNPQINEFAGRETDLIKLAAIAAPKRAKIEPTFALLVRSICRPFRANRTGRRFPGFETLGLVLQPLWGTALQAEASSLCSVRTVERCFQGPR
jgi:hypothetical protein